MDNSLSASSMWRLKQEEVEENGAGDNRSARLSIQLNDCNKSASRWKRKQVKATTRDLQDLASDSRARFKVAASSMKISEKIRSRDQKIILSSCKTQRSSLSKQNNYLLLSLLVVSATILIGSDFRVQLASGLGVSSSSAASRATPANLQQASDRLPDLTSQTSDEPIAALVGQDAFIACVAKNLQNYTVIWRYTNEANAPGSGSGPGAGQQPAAAATSAVEPGATADQRPDEVGVILTAGRQRVISDDRFSVIQSHDTWLLKISNLRLSDTGTYICHTNSEPRVRVLRILSVLKPNQTPVREADLVDSKAEHFSEIDYNFSDCCRAEYVRPRCQRLCSFQQLASRYQGINIVHECYSNLPSITRCMVAGRNVTDCCQKRHIPSKCNQMCGHLGDTSAMSVQDQSYCADYSASIMSCVAEGISTLPGQPELVIVEAVSSTTLKVSWQKVSDEKELKKVDGWIINLTKLSSFEDTISKPTSFSSLSSPQQVAASSGQPPKVSSSFSGGSSGGSSTSLSNLTIVDVMNNSSLAAMSKLLAASTGTISLKLDKTSNEFSIDNLKPYTVYQIQMFAYNSLGRSQLTDPIRALTLAPDNDNLLPSPAAESATSSEEAYVEPTLPDTRKCCQERGVTLNRCLDTLCDPVQADRATIADLMICAPWSNVTFSCLSSRVNHTECCKSRGVTPFCLSMCGGDIKRVDYRHFRCLTHMSSYTNCILESHNVLPSAPQNFTVGPITHAWAVLNWRSPRKHARSLQGYRIFWRKVEPVVGAISASGGSGPRPNRMGDREPSAQMMTTGPRPTTDGDPDDFLYSSAEAATNPYLLDALQPGTVYETFVVAVNRFGQSDSSIRFIFQTLPDPEQVLLSGQPARDELESRLPLHGNSSFSTTSSLPSGYNETSCCLNSGVHANCQQLCSYDLRVADASSLISQCSQQMPVILRCMAGSRNSVPCCRTRGVGDHCLNVCAGLAEHSPLVLATRCAPDFGKIIRCMDEGSRQIPGAPLDLHTVDIESDRVRIAWRPAPEDALRTDVEYHVRYQQLQQSPEPTSGSGAAPDLSALIAVVPLHPLEHNLIMTTNKTEAVMDKLRPNSRYSLYVTAENSYGISLPSLVLVIQTPDETTITTDDYKRKATLGAPHSLEILRSDTESIVLKWIAPLFTTSDAQIKYRVFYKMLGPAGNGSESASDAGTTTSSPINTSSSSQTEAPVQQVNTNWTVVETSETTTLLRNLRYSSQYVITVQAFSRQMLGHMSEILLASTAKPVPPTLNHPLVIGQPIEGNNITIMCVALGQPTPQISMFINGLLVQKRTQPYVIYHLVNLVRGHLTISCFASNGQGKDYASVQSRTEVSVKFGAKTVARNKEVRASAQSSARLSCEVTGNPQPTVVWTFVPASGQPGAGQVQVLGPSERVSTLLVSQFESPFTWTHTLSLRNASKSDSGQYQCRARNSLAESTETIQLSVVEAKSGPLIITDSSGSSVPRNETHAEVAAQYLRAIEGRSDLADCCRSQNVSSRCLPVCSLDGLDVEGAFKTPDCQRDLDKLMYCAADGSDHRNCCRSRQVPSSCLRWCSGARLQVAPALCFLSSAIDINQCFQEGRNLLPGPPRNLRVLLAADSEHSDQANEQAPSAQVATTMAGAGMFPAADRLVMSGAQPMGLVGADQSGNGASVISSMVMMMGEQQPQHAAPSDSSTSGQQQPPTNNGDGYNEHQQASDPLIIEWDPPSKNPALVQYYRIFWRPFGSRELSRTVTNLTWIKLNDLNVNKIYEFVVKAANTHGSSVYSEPLTVKPAEILVQSSNSIGSGSLIWFLPSSGAPSLFGRVMVAISFATLFMFGSLALVMFLERRGYLKRFASSKTNSSRISFANPAYLKDSDSGADGESSITWETGHSLDVLTPPTSTEQTSRSSSDGSISTTATIEASKQPPSTGTH